MNPPKAALDELRIDRSAVPERRGFGWLIPALAILALAGALAWWFNRAKSVEVRTVSVREITSGGQRTVLNASGYVTPRREATVSSKVTGKVIEVLTEEGMKVAAGQVLARIDDTNVRASVELATAQLEASKSALEETRVRVKEAGLQLRRTSDLARLNVASQSELDSAEAEAKSLIARLDRQQVEITVAERQLALWRRQLDDTTIRAPFAGIVTSKNAQPGEMISPMSSGGFTRTGICTIVDMDSLEIEVDVNESYINRVEPGQPVEAALDAYSDWKIPCKVIAIIPTADRQKATVQVRIGFDKLDPRILPQMAVKVAFRGAEVTSTATRSVVIPKTAVQRQDGRDLVQVFQNNRIERRAIVVSETRTDEVVISAGLSAGERVVAEWNAALADGVTVIEKNRTPNAGKSGGMN